MRDKELYQRILGVEAPWQVADVELELDGGEVRVRIVHDGKEGLSCPECGTPCPGYDHRSRHWRHLDTCTGAYAYDGSGNVSKIGSDYYLYDTLGRLKEGTALQAGSSNRQTYGYDGFGNLTSTTSWVNGSGTTRTNAVVGTTNRLSAAGYDAAGNQTTWGTYAYTWDLMGMMKAYQGSGNDWAFAYDADDERMFVYNVVSGQSTFRIRGLDGKVLREIKLTGSTWSWGKDWIYRDGQLLATTASGSVTRYAHADHLGSPRLFTDTAGVAKEKFHYYPFGEQAGTAPTAPEALRFTGHERDSGASSGTADDLDYMHARYYHPQLGRFLSGDPEKRRVALRNPQFFNHYGYAINNPLRLVDPNGECAAPAGLQSGQVGICIESFIAAPTIGGIGKGDNRTFTPNDPDATFRTSLRMVIEPKSGVILRSTKEAGRSEFVEPFSVIGAQGTQSTSIVVGQDSKGASMFVSVQGMNGLSAFNSFGSIDFDASLRVGKDGTVVLRSVDSKLFPSIEIFVYKIVDDELGSTTLFRFIETEPSALNGEKYRIFQLE